MRRPAQLRQLNLQTAVIDPAPGEILRAARTASSSTPSAESFLGVVPQVSAKQRTVRLSAQPEFRESILFRCEQVAGPIRKPIVHWKDQTAGPLYRQAAQ